MRIQKNHRVPPVQCRINSVVECEGATGCVGQGVVECLHTLRPGNCMVAFSIWVDEQGRIHVGPRNAAGSSHMMNLSSLTREIDLADERSQVGEGSSGAELAVSVKPAVHGRASRRQGVDDRLRRVMARKFEVSNGPADADSLTLAS